jgi:hypothetical protein
LIVGSYENIVVYVPFSVWQKDTNILLIVSFGEVSKDLLDG